MFKWKSAMLRFVALGTLIIFIRGEVKGVDFNFILHGLKGDITSPNYPSFYPLNISCIWTIKSLPGRTIKLRFLDFRLEKVKRCIYDYVQIREDPLTSWETLPRYCGIHAPKSYSSTKAFLQLRFRSDHLNGVDIGFKVQWESEVLPQQPDVLPSRSDKVILISFSSVLAVFILINLVLIFFLWRRSRELDDLRKSPKSASAEFTWIPYGKSAIQARENKESKKIFKQVPMGTATKMRDNSASYENFDNHVDRIRGERPTSYYNQLPTLDRPTRYDSLPSSVLTAPASSASELKDHGETTEMESCENTTNLYISSDVSLHESEHEKLHLNGDLENIPALTLV